MKKILVFSVVLLAISVCSFAAQKEDRELAKKQETEIQTSIDRRDYKIVVDRAYPQSGRSVSLTTLYNVKINGDSLRCYLPYFGRAYSLPYGGGEGLNFDSTISNYKIEAGKRNAMRVSFDTRSRDDQFRFSIDIYPDGSSSIQVQPTNRQSISFDGKVTIDRPKKRR